MHPAPSLIVFTTLSGLGFGLLAWLALGLPAYTGWIGAGYFALGFALAGGGLLASTLHLGNPQRALLAFTQWRTSWLSREAWLSMLALAVLGLTAAGRVFAETHWGALGALGAALAMATVLSTAMIYAQLATVPRWRHWTTPALFLSMSLGGGALLAGQSLAASALLALAGLVQLWAWHTGDARFRAAGSDTGTATALGARGRVRAFEPPHTGPNYLLREMAYRVGRKHSRRLRIIALVAGFALPSLMMTLGVKWVEMLAVLLHIGGAFAARWLFFAEAEHVMGLYYGEVA